MNKSEAERLAILETRFEERFDHIAQSIERIEATQKRGTAAQEALQATVAAWDNKLQGGRVAIGALVFVGGIIGSVATWLFKALSPFAASLPR